MNNIEAQLYGAFAAMNKLKTGPKLGTGGKRNKLRICLTADVEAFLRRNGDTIGTAVESSVRKSAAFKRWLTRDV